MASDTAAALHPGDRHLRRHLGFRHLTAAASGDNNQVWTLVPHGNRFLVENAGTGRYVTIAQGSPADLAKAVSWTEQDGPDQLWAIRRLNTD